MPSPFLKIDADGISLCEDLGDPDWPGDVVVIRITPEIHEQLLVHWHAAKHGRVPAPKAGPATGSEEGFDRFWAAYPRKDVKAAALKAWKTQRCAALADQIVADVERRAVSPDWTKDRGKYVPMATTYLNQQRYMDAEDTTPVEDEWA